MIQKLFPLSTTYDDCRRPRRDAPAADRKQKNLKNPCPAVPRRGPEASIHRMTEYELNGFLSVSPGLTSDW